MKKLIITAAAILAGCSPPAPKSAARRPEQALYVRISGYFTEAGTYKMCDAGRAIYVTEGSGSAIAVIDKAPECAPVAR